ncbi:MAG: hypothetical protein ABI841_07040 [Chloroflexota bacterium]
MNDRWRARTTGLAVILAAAAVAGLAWRAASADAQPALVVRLPDGAQLARVPLGPNGEFALRYRNSLYGSLVEERFAVGADRRIELVEIAADELAVLEEYYAIDEPALQAPAGDARAWTARPGNAVSIRELVVAATDLGERTLLVDGRPVAELWRLVDDGAASVVLELEAP